MSFEPLTPERRRELTRRHLLEAAAIVFARDGFHGATVDDIASLAGFTKGAVYSNFKSKDDLFLALLDDRVDREFAVTAEVLETGSRERADQFPRIRDLLQATSDDSFAALYLEFVLYARRNPVAREKLIASVRRERELIVELMERQYAAADRPPRRPPPVFAEYARSVFAGLTISRLVDPESVTPEIVEAALEMLYETITPDPIDDPGG